MSQLTKEEKEKFDKFVVYHKQWHEDFLVPEDWEKEGECTPCMHIRLIDRLSAKVEELEEWKRNSSDELVKAGMKIGALQSNLSSLLEAVEPIESVVKILDGWANAYQATVSLGDLRTLSTVAAGIKGGKG